MTDLRHFISHAPRFGSYANPIRSKVEQSPYYWWWYALTQNTTYCALCEVGGDLSLLAESQTETEQKDDAQRASTSSDSFKAQPNMLKVYADWGDVRYEGDRYQAFCAWWRERVNTNEQRGAYLFAEPLRGYWTRVVTDIDDAQAVAEDESHMLIAVPLNQMRLNAVKGAGRLIAKHIPERKGRAVSDPRSSKARYHLNTAVQPRALKLAFDVWDLRNDCAVDSIPQRIPKSLPHNVRIARAVGLQHKARSGEAATKAEEHRNLSTQVARYLRTARSMIAAAGEGTFPHNQSVQMHDA
jgi:hypothetical protein